MDAISAHQSSFPPRNMSCSPQMDKLNVPGCRLTLRCGVKDQNPSPPRSAVPGRAKVTHPQQTGAGEHDGKAKGFRLFYENSEEIVLLAATS